MIFPHFHDFPVISWEYWGAYVNRRRWVMGGYYNWKQMLSSISFTAVNINVKILILEGKGIIILTCERWHCSNKSLTQCIISYKKGYINVKKIFLKNYKYLNKFLIYYNLYSFLIGNLVALQPSCRLSTPIVLSTMESVTHILIAHLIVFETFFVGLKIRKTKQIVIYQLLQNRSKAKVDNFNK